MGKLTACHFKWLLDNLHFHWLRNSSNQANFETRGKLLVFDYSKLMPLWVEKRNIDSVKWWQVAWHTFYSAPWLASRVHLMQCSLSCLMPHCRNEVSPSLMQTQTTQWEHPGIPGVQSQPVLPLGLPAGWLEQVCSLSEQVIKPEFY